MRMIEGCGVWGELSDADGRLTQPALALCIRYRRCHFRSGLAERFDRIGSGLTSKTIDISGAYREADITARHPDRPCRGRDSLVAAMPVSQTGVELLFEVFSQRYERGLTIVTSNLPFDEWTSVFVQEWLTGVQPDRPTYHVRILEMNDETCRLKQSKRRQRAAGAGPDSEHGECPQRPCHRIRAAGSGPSADPRDHSSSRLRQEQPGVPARLTDAFFHRR